MTSIKPNKYQKEIYKFIDKGTGNAVINAVAGSGKTYTIVNSLNIIPEDKSVLFIAFNKSIVDELKSRIGFKPNVEIKTLHSLGASICYKEWHSKINPDKYKDHIKTCIKYSTYKPNKNLSDYNFKSWALNINLLSELGRIELADNIVDMQSIVFKHNIILEDNEIECALDCIDWGLKSISEIDFADMVYYPNVKKCIYIPKFDFVFIDECQDLNAAQRELFLKCVDPDDGRFIAVGDRNQVIYGFAGSDAESFDKLVHIPNTVELPLSVCYRCAKNIVKKAQKIVPNIEYKRGASEGIIDYSAKVENIQDGDMVISRTNAPLVRLCMIFLKDGRKAYIKGKDIGASLINLIKQSKCENTKDLIEFLRLYEEDLIKKICEQENCTIEDAKDTIPYNIYKDKADAIKYICEDYLKTSDVIQRIESIFSDSNGIGICLSTVHKAKVLKTKEFLLLINFIQSGQCKLLLVQNKRKM